MPRRFQVPAFLGVVLFVAGFNSMAAVAESAVDSQAVVIAEAAGSSGSVDPANFVSKVDNPWYPLVPGTNLIYRGEKDRKQADRIVAVTNRTIVIEGVTCVVVEDNLSFTGELAEKNLGYYAQDRQGNVWSFGEDAQEFEHGQVTATDSWRAGVDGALPSFIMESAPAVGDAFAHDYTKNHFAVVSLAEPVKVPYGSFADALVTKEWSPAERDVLTHKYYVRGVGEVRDVVVRGPKEEFLLISVKLAQ